MTPKPMKKKFNEKGKVVMVEQPKNKKKKSELDERIFVERQRKGIELT